MAESAYLKPDMATVAVFCTLLVVIIMAYRYSFHAMVKCKRWATTAIPGRAIGIMIYHSVCRRLQPSISAASSSAYGIAFKIADKHIAAIGHYKCRVYD